MSTILKTATSGERLSVVVRVPRLDAAVAREFKSAIDAAWVSGLREIEVDLDAVEFVDSSGIGALLSAYRKLPQGSGATKLLNVKPGVLSVLELLRLHRVFEIAS